MSDVERLERENAELRRIAALMYERCGDQFVECLNPSDEDCEADCSDCGWCANEVRDSLLAMGVDL